MCVLENCVCIRLHHSRYPADSPAYRCDNSVHLHLGALVSARYTGDDIWYRARIIAVYQNKGLLLPGWCQPVRQEFMENECEALPGVAYPGVRDNRSTINTKTGYDDDEYFGAAYRFCG